MATAASAQEIFDGMCERFRADKAGNESANFQFDLSGEGGGQWWTTIANGTCSAGTGSAPTAADITVTAQAADFVRLVNGEMNAMTGFMQGKFKVQGNMGIALKMINWFDMS